MAGVKSYAWILCTPETMSSGGSSIASSVVATAAPFQDLLENAKVAICELGLIGVEVCSTPGTSWATDSGVQAGRRS